MHSPAKHGVSITHPTVPTKPQLLAISILPSFQPGCIFPAVERINDNDDCNSGEVLGTRNKTKAKTKHRIGAIAIQRADGMLNRILRVDVVPRQPALQAIE